MTKSEWVEYLKKKGFDVYLDNNVVMFKTDNIEDAQKYKDAMQDYPYSYGIKRKGDSSDEADLEDE